jgi:hypothetical protein
MDSHDLRVARGARERWLVFAFDLKPVSPCSQIPRIADPQGCDDCLAAQPSKNKVRLTSSESGLNS